MIEKPRCNMRLGFDEVAGKGVIDIRPTAEGVAIPDFEVGESKLCLKSVFSASGEIEVIKKAREASSAGRSSGLDMWWPEKEVIPVKGEEFIDEA